MQDLAGHARALPVALTLLPCAFCAVSWRERSATPPAADKVQPTSDCKVITCVHFLALQADVFL